MISAVPPPPSDLRFMQGSDINAPKQPGASFNDPAPTITAPVAMRRASNSCYANVPRNCKAVDAAPLTLLTPNPSAGDQDVATDEVRSCSARVPSRCWNWNPRNFVVG